MMQNFMEPYSNNMALKAKKSNSSNHSDNECIDATQVNRRKYCSLRLAAWRCGGFEKRQARTDDAQIYKC
jgi:hypothetical protein